MIIHESKSQTESAEEPRNQLTDDQLERRRAIDAPWSARVLVEAGPGTGKTEIAAQRLAALVKDHLSPSHILVLSFSRSAVRTLMLRMSAVAGNNEHIVEELRHVSVRTFDSWAFRILRLMGSPTDVLLRRPHEANIVALTDLILSNRQEAVLQAIGNRRHLIVDEFQDLPGVRGELVLALLDLIAPAGRDGCGFTVLGDPAQAIYSFAAKRPDGTPYPPPADYWRQITDRYSRELKIVRLTHNHRSVAPIADLSTLLRNVLLGDSSDAAKLEAVRGALAQLPETADLTFDDFQDQGSTAILTRTNGEAVRVLTRLLGNTTATPAVPVRMHAANYASLSPAWIAALLRPVRSGSVTKSQFERIFQYLTGIWDENTRSELRLPTLGIAWSRLALAAGAPADATSFELASLRTRLNWPDAFPDDQHVPDGGLMITTVHQSKGKEFDLVTILEGRPELSGEDAASDVTPAEEANVSYVAITRAAKQLRRASSKSIYAPLTRWSFRNDRTRLCNWWRGWVNLEVGQKGDIDPTSFVDPKLHGDNGVEELQHFLLRSARLLEGRKVLLVKRLSDGNAKWAIHLQEDDNTEGRLLGVTSSELTYDLLHILHPKGYGLPWRIYNLRISSVGTITSEADHRLNAPESSSRLWLGVSLFGTGDFQPKKQKASK